MKKSKPLVDKDGEVRELLIEDIKEFRPIAEVASSSLAAKLGVQATQASSAALSRKRSAAARKAWQTRRRSTA
jgi:hypothetical protein